MSKKGLDKNSLIGLLLIGAIMLVFSIFTQPTEEELKAKEKKQQQKELLEQKTKEKPNKEVIVTDNDSSIITTDDDSSSVVVTSDTLAAAEKDSLNKLVSFATYGPFSNASSNKSKNFKIENDLLKITLSSKGGRITSVQLKKFHTYDSLPLYLFHEDSSKFNLELTIPGVTGGNTIRTIGTQDLVFEPTGESFVVSGENKKSISFKLFDNSKSNYIEYVYTLSGNSYVVDFDINVNGMDKVLSKYSPIYLNWSMLTPNQEKTIKNQQDKSTVYFKYSNDEVDYINEMKYETLEMEGDVDWVMIKQQYFNSTLIAKSNSFLQPDSKVRTFEVPNSTTYVQGMDVDLTIPYNGTTSEANQYAFYFGPNKYDILKEMGMELEETMNYGWGIFGWVNMIVIRPIFNFLNGFGWHIGLIIFLLTVIIKLVLFPITWKTYLSSAKMRVLKPEITELTEKYKNDAVKKQQATMALYRQTGVNPLAGCIPVLIQMPILFALFRFFPATFDLRQKSFLWADDLSTYDSIYELPFEIPFYGDHVSLFTLLMAISMIFYTRVNSQMTSGAGMEGAMAAQMKIMMYLMPVMMLFFFNSYSSGLSYYYLVANLITIGQQIVIRKWIVDEDKIRAKIQANKTKPKKKSKFAQRLEQRMKEVQVNQQKKKK